MQGAELILTNTFHGVIFSVILNRPFWVVGPLPRCVSRGTTAYLPHSGSMPFRGWGRSLDASYRRPSLMTFISSL